MVFHTIWQRQRRRIKTRTATRLTLCGTSKQRQGTQTLQTLIKSRWQFLLTPHLSVFSSHSPFAVQNLHTFDFYYIHPQALLFQRFFQFQPLMLFYSYLDRFFTQININCINLCNKDFRLAIYREIKWLQLDSNPVPFSS